MGGGSGGHAFPLMAVADAIRRQALGQNVDVELLAMGGAGFLGPAAQQHQVPYKTILSAKFRRYFSLLFLWDIIKLPISLAQALWYVFWFMPDAVFSKGGYDSVMPIFAAWLYRIPVYVHESDTVPGLANRIASKFARSVLLAFPAAAKFFSGKSSVTVGNPIRGGILGGDKIAAYDHFKLRPGIRTIFVIGGSQGAKQINDIILDSLVVLTNSYQVVHQCGASQYGAVRGRVDQLIREGKASYGPGLEDRYRLYSSLDERELGLVFALADVVVSRAGASSLSEIAAVGKPAVVVPIADSANNHQFLNAMEFSHYGGVVVEGANITPHILLNQIQSLLEPERNAAVSREIQKFAKLDAADKIAQILLQ